MPLADGFWPQASSFKLWMPCEGIYGALGPPNVTCSPKETRTELKTDVTSIVTNLGLKNGLISSGGIGIVGDTLGFTKSFSTEKKWCLGNDPSLSGLGLYSGCYVGF